MISRMSSMFLRTLRDDPADAEVPSHKLLVRAGYVRRVAPGIYSWLPLGKTVLDNIARIVKEEMDRVGAQEVLLPALLPREFYEATGRWSEYGPLLFRLKDRKGVDYLLGPTHEEIFTLMAKGEYSSYKDLPVILYQIQTKYRDEARPRAGILRGREFVMKDSYSFDIDDEGLKRSYELHREAYIRISSRLGMDFRIVSAMSGAMGGSASEEFLAPAPTGEDTFVSCTNCDFAANTEAVEGRPGAVLDASGEPAATVHDTPDSPTIDSLVERFNALGLGRTFTAADTLKNVVVKLRHPSADAAKPGRTEVLIVGVPGDREVDLKRLEAAVSPAEVELFEAADFAAHPNLIRGYIGPQGLGLAPDGKPYTYKVDPLVLPGSSWVTGANLEGKHAANVVSGRDFTPAGTVGAVEVRDGDPCPRCGGALVIERGIEIGHIFQLGRKYADAFEFDVLGPDGKPARVTMGSYGYGVSRAVAAIAEQKHDELGLVWPREVAPADVHLVATGKDDTVFDAANRLAGELDAAGARVIYDDRRGVSPGVKFKDAELIGVPTIVVVGRGLADGLVEVRDRASGERREVPVAEAAAQIVAGF